MVGVGLFGYVISSVTSLVMNMDPIAHMTKESTDRVKSFIQQFPNHNENTIRDARSQLEAKFRIQTPFDEQSLIMENLPLFLKNEIMNYSYHDTFYSLFFIHNLENVIPKAATLIIPHFR